MLLQVEQVPGDGATVVWRRNLLQMAFCVNSLLSLAQSGANDDKRLRSVLQNASLDEMFSHAALQLSTLDLTFEKRCMPSFERDPKTYNPKVHNECMHAVMAARELFNSLGRDAWEHVRQGCPHMKDWLGSSGSEIPHKRNEGDHCRPWLGYKFKSHDRYEKRPKALIVLYGLHRYYRDGWSHLQRQLINANPSKVEDRRRRVKWSGDGE